MRIFALALSFLAFAIPTTSQAADAELGRRAVRTGVGYFIPGGIYVGRGIYQDSGWAYEVPVYQGCQVRIIQTPRGIDRMRRCIGPVVARAF